MSLQVGLVFSWPVGVHWVVVVVLDTGVVVVDVEAAIVVEVEVLAVTVVVVVACTVVEVVLVVGIVGHVQSWLQGRKAPAGEPGGQVMLPGGSHCSGGWRMPSPQTWAVVVVVEVVAVVVVVVSGAPHPVIRLSSMGRSQISCSANHP